LIVPKEAFSYYAILHDKLPGPSPKHQIEVLSVASGIRPSSFLDWYGKDHTELYQTAHSFDKIAESLGLQRVVANAPSLWFPDRGADTIEADACARMTP
jgi:hypothetical protein